MVFRVLAVLALVQSLSFAASGDDLHPRARPTNGNGVKYSPDPASGKYKTEYRCFPQSQDPAFNKFVAYFVVLVKAKDPRRAYQEATLNVFYLATGASKERPMKIFKGAGQLRVKDEEGYQYHYGAWKNGDLLKIRYLGRHDDHLDFAGDFVMDDEFRYPVKCDIELE